MNRWKIAFFTVVSIVGIVTAALFIFLYMPPEDEIPQGRSNIELSDEDTVEFTVGASKENLNQLIQHYLVEEADANQLDYEVVLEDKVYLLGKIRAFSTDIDARIAFVPIVKTDGNVLLKVESLSLGRLQLPVAYALQYVDGTYQLPDFVYISPKQQSIDIQLSEVQFENGLQTRAEMLDLENDNIRFRLIVPVDTLREVPQG
ncbi:YpmS family protein [Metabacillus lacus]|nr:YpmS family protein [Metabacillus lacus]